MRSDDAAKAEGPSAAGPTARREARVRGGEHPRLLLLRHGEPDWAPKDGRLVSDPGLTPFGVEQAAAAAEALQAYAPTALYVSPYRRAQETALPLARKTNLSPVTRDDLAEVGIVVEGRTQEEVDRYFVEGSRRPLPEHWEGLPGAETFTAFHERVTRALRELLAEHGIRPRRAHDFTLWDSPEPPPTIAIVAHGGTNAVLLTELLDVRPVPWEWVRFESPLAAYSVLQARPLGEHGRVWSLQNFGEVEHVRRRGLG